MTLTQQRKLLKDLDYTRNAPDKPKPRRPRLKSPEAWDWYSMFY